jgi:hypothetical protein
MRDLARPLRGEQSGPEWQELREAVSDLVCRLVDNNPDAYRLADYRYGLACSILVPLTECAAALRSDGAVFLLECLSDGRPYEAPKVGEDQSDPP